jgi:hypothetical protein
MEMSYHGVIMRLFFLALVFFVQTEVSFAAVDVVMKKQKVSWEYTQYNVTVSAGRSVNIKKVYVVNAGEKEPKKFLWIFHGYKPAGDPYLQSPVEFISKWDLASLCRKHNIVCVIPDMGTSMYLLSELNDSDKISDMRFLKELYNEIIFKNYKDAPVILAGVSTGAEGAVKFSTTIQNVESITGISGTYDFFSLDKKSGEYRIHEHALGKESPEWIKENPLDILKRSVRTRIYLMSEQNSMYKHQADILLENKMSNLEAVDLLSIGKGHSHNWSFWGSWKLKKELWKIITGSETP